MKNFVAKRLLALPVVILIGIVSLFALYPALQHFVGPAQTANAQSSNLGSLTGYAWSDNLGWVSFNDGNVVIQSDGTLAGYAWANPRDDVSSTNNIGWISFNAADTASCGAVARLTGTTITGWAKVLSADNNGWNGCVSLSGSSPAYGVILNSTGSSQSGTLDGWAWADNTVGGWISFNCDTGGLTANNICATSNYAVTYSTNTPPPPTINIGPFSASPARVRTGQPSSLTYSVTVSAGVTCTITGTDGSSYPVTTDSLQHTIPTNNITKNTMFTLVCDTSSKSVTVGLVPVYQEQ